VDAITRIAKTKKVVVERTQAEWMTTGDPENYFHAHLKFVMEYEKYGSKVTDWMTELSR
jgi:UTP-glucose-1-phosphate uridylyltransferase